MLGYRKRSFTRAHELLTALRVNPEDLGSLTTLQRLLFSETLRTEGKIRELKAELKGVQETGAIAGIDAPERLLFATEADLLSIPRIDEKAFEEIAQYRARFLAA
jgi:hypothetical protein